MITQLKEKVLNGGQITREEAILLSNAVDKQALYRAAGEIRDKRVGRRFDTCSIINARSEDVRRIVNGVPNRLCLKRI